VVLWLYKDRALVAGKVGIKWGTTLPRILDPLKSCTESFMMQCRRHFVLSGGNIHPQFYLDFVSPSIQAKAFDPLAVVSVLATRKRTGYGDCPSPY
jgi:hypothetical protein